MTRVRLAITLAVLAGVAVVATAALAVATHVGGDEPERLTVRDPASGATLEVPAEGWRVRAVGDRISYGAASVAGPAVLAEGYCAAERQGSFRAVAGFTHQPFDVWVRALGGGATEPMRRDVTLGGATAALQWADLRGAGGPCAAPGIEVAMVRAGDLRAVVVADSGAEGTLSHAEIERVLLSLQLP